ncbi:hypothetical protein [Brevibacterium album]|uniref:hypothetical protein n=1 Tax=Brevibacterium album TaxID=417948 RepID=UPI000400FF4D|nr:hypothetical protein [Brevibacterium album]
MIDSPHGSPSRPITDRTDRTAAPGPGSRGLVLLVLGLALLGVPRVVLHDLHIIEEGTALNALFVFVPVVVWVAAVLLLRVRRPFLVLLVVGLVYGVLLAAVHQIFWATTFPGGPPQLGGNLAGLAPEVHSLIVRGFSVFSSLVTGTLVGAVCGLVAAGLDALRTRMRPGTAS